MCVSCDPETETFDDSTLGYSYAPLELGKEYIYEYDSILYKQGGNIRDTITGFIRESISSEFINSVGDTSYTIERSSKQLESDPWSAPRIWTASRNATNFQRTEENIKFIKLVFPPVLNKNWDGNTFFDSNTFFMIGGEELQPYRDWDYTIEEVDLSYEAGNVQSEDVIRVQHVAFDDIIEWRYSEELYANGIGLVFKRMEILDRQCMPSPCVGDFIDTAQKGFILEQRLISFQ